MADSVGRLEQSLFSGIRLDIYTGAYNIQCLDNIRAVWTCKNTRTQEKCMKMQGDSLYFMTPVCGNYCFLVA